MLYSATGWGLLYFEYFKQRIEFKMRYRIKLLQERLNKNKDYYIFSQRPFIFTVLALAAACMKIHLKLYVLLSIKVAQRTHQL